MASSGMTCSICVDKFENSEDLCSTVCGHIFHFSCLQQWQERSNTCPLCNRREPNPHRLFLDLTDAPKSDSSAKDAGNDEHAVVIKGVQQHLMLTSLHDVVLSLARTMNVSIRQHDIKDVSNKDNELKVVFYAARHKEMFMEFKFRLKKNQQTSGVNIHEVIDEETKDLFHYAHRIKPLGFRIIFVKNRKIYAKKTHNEEPINICSREQVDSICGKTDNSNATSAGNNSRNRRKSNNKPATSNRAQNRVMQNSNQPPRTAVNTTNRGTGGAQNSGTSVLNRAANPDVRSSVRSENTTTSGFTQLSNNTANPTVRSSVRSQNTATSAAATSPSHRESVGANAPSTARNNGTSHTTPTTSNVTISSFQAYDAPTAPDISLVTHIDSDSANLIRRLIMQDSVESIPVYRDVYQVRPRLSPIPRSRLQPQRPTTLKKSIMGVFKKIANTFKKQPDYF